MVKNMVTSTIPDWKDAFLMQFPVISLEILQDDCRNNSNPHLPQLKPLEDHCAASCKLHKHLTLPDYWVNCSCKLQEKMLTGLALFDRITKLVQTNLNFSLSMLFLPNVPKLPLILSLPTQSGQTGPCGVTYKVIRLYIWRRKRMKATIKIYIQRRSPMAFGDPRVRRFY